MFARIKDKHTARSKRVGITWTILSRCCGPVVAFLAARMCACLSDPDFPDLNWLFTDYVWDADTQHWERLYFHLPAWVFVV
jgi:hypothetical protein